MVILLKPEPMVGWALPENNALLLKMVAKIITENLLNPSVFRRFFLIVSGFNIGINLLENINNFFYKKI